MLKHPFGAASAPGHPPAQKFLFCPHPAQSAIKRIRATRLISTSSAGGAPAFSPIMPSLTRHIKHKRATIDCRAIIDV
jgi:hypothetical protein